MRLDAIGSKVTTEQKRKRKIIIELKYKQCDKELIINIGTVCANFKYENKKNDDRNSKRGIDERQSGDSARVKQITSERETERG